MEFITPVPWMITVCILVVGVFFIYLAMVDMSGKNGGDASKSAIFSLAIGLIVSGIGLASVVNLLGWIGS